MSDEQGHLCHLTERDPELEDVLRAIERLLNVGAALNGPPQDAHLSVVEAVAAPYAIAFLEEIRRLDEMLSERLCPP